MAAQDNLKSAAITALDATPPRRPTAGQEGGGAYLYDVVGIVGPTTNGATTGGILRAVRVPSNAIIRDIMYAQKAATTTASFDFGAYYSTGNDGTTTANSGLVIDADYFATAVNTAAVINWTSIMFEATTVDATDAVTPLWQALGLSEDPGGFIDIVAVNKATIDGAATLAVRVQYVMAAQ